MSPRPLLGQFELVGVERIDSTESRALVEHRVPGLRGSYLQDLGTAPHRVVVHGSGAGDEARDAFLTGVRELFATGEPTTFVADITTATDLVDVVVDELDVTETAGSATTFTYRISLQQYTRPPEPPTAGLSGLDAGILDDARNALDALEAIDALSSLSGLADPTAPLLTSLDGVRSALAGVEQLTTALDALLGRPS